MERRPEAATEGSEMLRILIMGCSRSGTTLLQGLLANHSRVHTFPESGVFLRALGMRGGVLPWTRMGLTAGKERKALQRLLSAQKDAPGRLPDLPPRRLLLSRSLSDVVAFLDGLARAHGKDAWVEKTPRHVFHARTIGRRVPGAWCVHMVRRGEDVVASIVDRARRNPGRFSGQESPSYGTHQWNRSLRATLAALGEPGHVMVLYEALADRTEETLRALSEVIGLDFEKRMLTPADRSTFSDPSETWKSSVEGPVRPAQSKFEDLFDQDTRSWISRNLASRTLESFLSRSSGVSGAGVHVGKPSGTAG